MIINMEVPENLPYKWQIEEAIRNNNLERCLDQLMQIAENNERIIKEALRNNTTLRSLTWEGNNIIGYEEVDNIDQKLDNLTIDAYQAYKKIKLVEKWAKSEGLL